MTQTTIFLSVTSGTDSLTLDGNLYLFKELLAIFNSTAKESYQVSSQIQANESEKEKIYVSE